MPNSDNRLPQPTSFSQDLTRAGRRPEDLFSSSFDDQFLATNNEAISSVASKDEADKHHGDSTPIPDPTLPVIGGPLQPQHVQDVSHAYPSSSFPASSFNNESHSMETPPPRPIFGVSLEDLLKRDGSAIPLVVYQCIQAVDLFGLEVEGIYRLSGSAVHITKLRVMFDNGKLTMLQRYISKLISHIKTLTKSIFVILKVFFRT